MAAESIEFFHTIPESEQEVLIAGAQKFREKLDNALSAGVSSTMSLEQIQRMRRQMLINPVVQFANPLHLDSLHDPFDYFTPEELIRALTYAEQIPSEQWNKMPVFVGIAHIKEEHKLNTVAVETQRRDVWLQHALERMCARIIEKDKKADLSSRFAYYEALLSMAMKLIKKQYIGRNFPKSK